MKIFHLKEHFKQFKTASKEHEKNKLLQIKRRFSRIDLFSKKECAGGTGQMKKDMDRKDSL